MTDTVLSAQIGQLRRSGANVLMLFALPKQTIAGFVAANRLGWRPPTYVTSVSVDPAVMKIVQTTTGNKAGEGALTVHRQWGRGLRALGDHVLGEVAAVDVRLVIAALDGLRSSALASGEVDAPWLRGAVRRQLEALLG